MSAALFQNPQKIVCLDLDKLKFRVELKNTNISK